MPEVSEVLAIGSRPLPPPVDCLCRGSQDPNQSQDHRHQEEEEDQEYRFAESDTDMNGDEIAGENA